MCSREIFTKKCLQQQIFDSDLKGAWHYNHVTFTPIAKNFMLYCRLIYMLSILCVRLTIKVKVGIPESFKGGWYAPKKTGSSHLKIETFSGRRRPDWQRKPGTEAAASRQNLNIKIAVNSEGRRPRRISKRKIWLHTELRE